jgi:hypothetical protein
MGGAGIVVGDLLSYSAFGLSIFPGIQDIVA